MTAENEITACEYRHTVPEQERESLVGDTLTSHV